MRGNLCACTRNCESTARSASRAICAPTASRTATSRQRSRSTAESNETALVRHRLKRRMKTMRGPLDERRVASLYRSLLRAGFAADTIRRELSAITKNLWKRSGGNSRRGRLVVND